MKQIGKIDQFQLLTDANDILFLKLPVTFTDGSGVDLAMTPGELTNLIRHLLEINQTLTEIEAETLTPGVSGNVGPITVHDLGLAQVDPATDDSALIVADLAWSRLLLRVPLASLSSLGSAMCQTAKTLAAPSGLRH